MHPKEFHIVFHLHHKVLLITQKCIVVFRNSEYHNRSATRNCNNNFVSEIININKTIKTYNKIHTCQQQKCL